MNTYHIKYKMNSKWISVEVQGTDIESTLFKAKEEISKIGWTGGILICGEQCDGTFNF